MLKKFIRYFIPQGYCTDKENLRLAKLTVGTYIIVACFNISYIIISHSIDYTGGLYSQIPMFIISIICLILFKNNVNKNYINTLFFIFCIISISITIHYTKGYESFILPWIATTPIVALLVTGKRGGYMTLIGCSLTLLYFFIMHIEGKQYFEDYNLKYKDIFSFSTYLGLIFILFAVAIFFENAKNTALKIVDDRNAQLKKEKKRSDDLLLNILPFEVMTELKETGHSKARLFTHVSVLFSDFVNFTQISEKMSPVELVAEIDICFKAFDEIMERNGLEKIKTIGDAYLAVCGMPTEDEQHAIKTIQAGFEILAFIEDRKRNGGKFDVRIGIHSGSLVAGIVGVKKFAYDIWGDTVNTASRMESNGEPGKINISDTTYKLVRDNFGCKSRGKIEVKGKGLTAMYFVNNNQNV